MVKNILYAIATILLLTAAWFVYNWFNSDPGNKEPLPALLSTISTIIVTIIAWRLDGNKQEPPSNAADIRGNNNIVNQGVSNSHIQIHNGMGDNTQSNEKV